MTKERIVLTERTEALTSYNEPEKHNYRGIWLFTAKHSNHYIVEPLHEEIRQILNESSDIWGDTMSSCYDNLSDYASRETLLNRARKEIDDILSGQELKEQMALEVKWLSNKLKRHEERKNFFNKLEKQNSET